MSCLILQLFPPSTNHSNYIYYPESDMLCSLPGPDLLYPFIPYTPALIWLFPVQIACGNLADTYTACQSQGHRSLFSLTIVGVLITPLITALGNSRHGVKELYCQLPSGTMPITSQGLFLIN